MAAFQEILDVLPGRLQTLDFSAAQELRLRVGQAPAVLENGREIYSSLNPFQEESYRRLYGDKSWPSRDALTVQNEGMIMIGTRSDAYTIVAVSQPDVPKIFGHQRPQGEAFMLTLLASGFAAIVIIVLLSLIFTNYQIKQLMRPVNALAEAAQRVEQGNFSQPVAYGGED